MKILVFKLNWCSTNWIEDVRIPQKHKAFQRIQKYSKLISFEHFWILWNALFLGICQSTAYSFREPSTVDIGVCATYADLRFLFVWPSYSRISRSCSRKSRSLRPNSRSPKLHPGESPFFNFCFIDYFLFRSVFDFWFPDADLQKTSVEIICSLYLRPNGI